MKTKNELIKEKSVTLIELGIYFDNLIRDGKYKDEKSVILSEKLHHCEKDLYAIELEKNKDADFKCPACMQLTDKSTKFCSSCGYNIEEYLNRPVITCQFCGCELEKDSKYCSVCGIKL